MAEAKQKHDWQQTSLIAAVIANTARDDKKKHTPFQPADFDPFTRAKTKQDGQRFNIKDLKPHFGLR